MANAVLPGNRLQTALTVEVGLNGRTLEVNAVASIRALGSSDAQSGVSNQTTLQGAGHPLSRPLVPNDLSCADYKDEFMLGDRRYCYPLTISDFASRYLLTCEALSTTQEVYAFTVFERVFKEFGLPKAIRTDNGVPFASQRPVRPQEAVHLVAVPRPPHRAHPPRSPRAEWPP